jgi:tetratricopeptide (TPR) repeat protein
MNKLAVMVMIGVVSCALSMNAVAEDTNATDLLSAQVKVSCALRDQGRAAEAMAVCEKGLQDYPTASATIRARAQSEIAYRLIDLGRTADSAAAFRKVLTDYPTADPGFLGGISVRVWQNYMRAGKYAEAEAACRRTITDLPTAQVSVLAEAQRGIGEALQAQGKRVEANAAYMTCVETYVWELGAKNEKGIIWQVFDRISPKLTTVEDYTTFLQNTIKATKAVEEHAAFLGRLKSELGKMQP